MVTRRTTPKAKAAAMLKSFEADYKTAYKTKNPQLLEKYFKDLSEDHLKQLCNSANIDARKRETRVAALAAALLERKTTTQKALRVMHAILRVFAKAGTIFAIICAGEQTFTHAQNGERGLAALVSLILFANIHSLVESFIKSKKLGKQAGTTKASRRLLRQMRALHTVRAPSKTSKTKKSS